MRFRSRLEKISITLMVALLCGLTIAASSLPRKEHSSEAIKFKSSEVKQDFSKLFKKHELLKLDSREAAKQVRQNNRLTLITSGGALDLILDAHDMRGPTYRATEMGADRAERTLERSPVRTFKGRVANWNNSHARFTVTEDRIEGVIFTPDERYFIEPATNYSVSAMPSDLLFYKASDVLQPATNQEPSEMCGVSLSQKIESAGRQVAPQTSKAISSSALVAELATEADYEYVTSMGGSENANNEILSIMNQVEGVYETELGITFEIVYQNTWATENDPYTATNDASLMLSEFANYWNANYAHVTRDITNMWTRRPTGRYSGMAFVGSACLYPQPSAAYSIALVFKDDPLRFALIAHEIGHLFGATHEQLEPGCEGTIMFYNSIQTTLTFCQFSRDQIRQYLSRLTGCPTTRYRISGRVVDEKGSGVGGVTLTLSGTQFIKAETEASGAYSFKDLLMGNYTVTPSKSGLSFNPQSRTFNDLNSDQLADFTAAASTVEIPVLLGEEISRRAIALDSVTWMRDPFSPMSTHNLSSDGRTRVMLFALNLNQSSGVSAQAEDLQRKTYQLPIEFIGRVPTVDWLTQINVRLPAELMGAGDVWVSINVQGAVSNKVIVQIK